MSRALGPQHPVYWQRDGEHRLWVKTQLDGHDYWMGFPSAGLIPTAGRLLVAGSLAAAASAVARGETPPPLATAGPSEIAAVAISFDQMTKSLARAEQERTLMLAGVSHDLRTPLSKLRLCIEMLRNGADPTLIESRVSFPLSDAMQAFGSR